MKKPPEGGFSTCYLDRFYYVLGQFPRFHFPMQIPWCPATVPLPMAVKDYQLQVMGRLLRRGPTHKAGGAELSRPTDLISQQSNYSRFKFPRIKLIIAVVASPEVKIMAMPATLQNGIFSLGIKSHPYHRYHGASLSLQPHQYPRKYWLGPKGPTQRGSDGSTAAGGGNRGPRQGQSRRAQLLQVRARGT